MKPKPTQEQNSPSVVQDGGAAAASGFSMGKSLFGEKPESLYQVKRIRCGNVNCWLVSGSKALPTNGSVLVDTGRKEDFLKLEQICRENRVKLILLTHGHPDHAGSAALLRQSLHIPVALGKADLPLLEHPAARPLHSRGVLGKVLLAFSRKSLSQPGTDFRPELLLEGGEDFYRYGFSIRALALPGHTAGSIGYEINHRYLCTGDAVMNLPWPAPALLFEDEEQAAQSTNKIAGLGKRVILPGHGAALWNRQW